MGIMDTAANHYGHRVTLTRWPNDRATMRCEDCDQHISTGSTIPQDKPMVPQEWPQVVTGVLEDSVHVGLYLKPDEPNAR